MLTWPAPLSKPTILGTRPTAWAFGGGGIAISYPLAEALNNMEDACLQRYSQLFGSDDRLHACISELGIPLTREAGFHQWDVRGNAFGLLAAHPVAPFVSMHHLKTSSN